MLDATSWVVSAVIPAVMMLLTGWLAAFCEARSLRMEASQKTSGCYGRLAPLLLSLGWAVAVTVGLFGQRVTGAAESSHWWPEEFWQRGYWLIFAAAIVLGGSTNPGWRDRPVRWVLAGLLAVCTAAISLPVGEGWEDVLPLQRGWLVLLSSSCLLGFWALDRLSITNADRWFPLTILAMLAGPLLVAVTTYTGLVQWTIAAIAATLPLVGFALFGWISSRTAAGLAYPAVVFTTMMMSAGRFYSYENHPWWTYLGLLLVPLAIVSADYPLRHRPTWLRMLVAAAVSLAVIGLSAWLQYNPETAGAENW